MKTLHYLMLACMAMAMALHAQAGSIVPFGATWKYLDDGSNQGTAWRDVSFDDSAWASGPAELGYGDGDEVTAIGFIDTDPGTAGDQKNATTYFRTTVNVTNPAQFTSYKLTLIYDDAGAVFINGTEVARTSNLPGGAVFNTFSASGPGDNAEKIWVFQPGLLVAGQNTIAVEIHQDGASSSDVSFDFELLGLVEMPIVHFGATWKYLDDGSDQGTAWRNVSFDDSTWASGPAELGYGDGDEATAIGFIDTDPGTAGDQKNATTYFRATFDMPDPGLFISYKLTLLYDDAGAVFINGTEVVRTPNLPGAAAFDTFSGSGPSDNATRTSIFPPGLLVAGDNTIAVEIHQDGPTSSDLSFDFQLVGIVEASVTRAPYLLMNNDSGMTIRWRTDAFTDSVVRTGTAQGVLTTTTMDAALTTEHEVRVNGLQPDTKYFYSIGSTSETLAGDDADHFFMTAPVPGTDRPTRIWLLGDSGTANANQRAVRNAYYGSAEYKFNDLLVLLGDNAYNSGQDSEYQRALFNTYPAVLRQSPVWSCLGNHETDQDRTGSYGGVPYFDIFTFPTAAECGGYPSGTERYFSWDYGNIHFISLDLQTSNSALRADMLAWLANDLAANTRRWTVAVWHHPPYTKGSHDSDAESQPTWARENVVPMLEDAGVDIVINGHSHCYERSWFIDGYHATPTLITGGTVVDGGDGRGGGDGGYGKDYGAHQGTVFVVAGSSGQATTWDDGSTALYNPHPHPVMFHSELELGSLILDIDGNRLDAKFITSAGTIDDYFSIEKGPVVTVDTLVTEAAEYGPVAGRFSVARTGSTAAPLTVQATIGGTAPASRYAPITVPVTIPAGMVSQTMDVTPVPNAIVQGAQSVTLSSDPNIEYRLGTVTSGEVSITDTPAGAPPIATWHLAKFGADANNETIRADSADPDFDAIVNLLEYALGLEPLIAAQTGIPSLDGSGSFLTLSVQKNPAATDVSYSVQVNDDIANEPGWSASGTTVLQDTPTLLEVRDDVPISAATRRYIRLQVTRP